MSSAQTQSTDADGISQSFRLFLVYDNASGEIITYGFAARDTCEDGGASMSAQAGVGQTALAIAEYPDPATMHVVNGVVVLR